MSNEIHFDRHMSYEDSLMWRVEKDPVLRSTITAVTLLDSGPDRERVEEKIRRAALVIPRLRQRVFQAPLGLSTPVWAYDPDFDIRCHLQWVRAPGDGSFRSLLDMASSLAMVGFDRSRPLWHFTVVEDLANGEAALIQKIHHSVTDGVGGVMLMQRVFDVAADADLAEEDLAEPDGERYSAPHLALESFTRGARGAVPLVRRGLDLAGHFARRPVRTLREWTADLDSVARAVAPIREPMSPIMRDRSSRLRFQALTVPFPDLKAAAKRAGCKLNDAFVAALSSGWHRYHLAHGADPDELRMTMPINLRDEAHANDPGNHIMLARFPVPVRSGNPDERMRAMRNIVRRERAEPANNYVDRIAFFLNQLPTAALTTIFGGMLKHVDFTASNVPGPPVPLYLGGARVQGMFAFAPPSGAAANLTLLSYLDQAGVTLNVDPAAVPDDAFLLECMQEGFDEVLKAT